MLVIHFSVIFQSEENIAFLKEKRLLEIDYHPSVHCGSTTKYYTRKERGKDQTVIRCYILIIIYYIFIIIYINIEI